MKKKFADISKPGQGKLKNALAFASFMVSRPGYQLFKKAAKKLSARAGIGGGQKISYDEWAKAASNADVLKKEYDAIFPTLKIKPQIGIILPEMNGEAKEIQISIDSVLTQSYANLQLFIVANSDNNTEELRKIYTEQDKRIRLSLKQEDLTTTGVDYLLFMKPDDVLAPNCLLAFAGHINNHPNDELVYCDEDFIDDTGHLSKPYFKPDWAQDNLLSGNYIGNAALIKKELLVKCAVVNTAAVASDTYDLWLRATEQTSHIGHIVKMLYHKRITAVNEETISSGKMALEDAMLRRGTPATVIALPNAPGNYQIQYRVVHPEKVSIIIPTKDQPSLLKTAIDSIIERTDYPDYEIIVLDNNSNTPEFFALMQEYEQRHPSVFRCEKAAFPFNYARLMNLGASLSTGTYLLMLNNDVAVIHADWMTQMVSYAQRAHTGAVGAKLLYPDDTVQHAGIVLGVNGDAAHVFAHKKKDDSGYFNYLQTVRNYAAVTGACMMCRKAVYDSVGGMDERLVVEYNDIDLCLKFISEGYSNVYLPTVALYHYESATRAHPFRSRKSYKQHEQDLAIFKGKWGKYTTDDPYYNHKLIERFSDTK